MDEESPRASGKINFVGLWSIDFNFLFPLPSSSFITTYEPPIMKKLGSLFSKTSKTSKSSQTSQSKPSDPEPHESEAQKTEVISDAEAAKIDEVSDVFSEYLQNLWNYLLKYGDDQKLGLENVANLGIAYGRLDIDGVDGGEAQESISLCASTHVDDTSDFFQPMDLAKFNTYYIDMDNDDTRRFAKEYLFVGR